MTERDVSRQSAVESFEGSALPRGRDGWAALPYVEADEIFALDAAFKRDPRLEVSSSEVDVGNGKMNLSIGVFVNEAGALHVSEAVTHARGRRQRFEGVPSPYLNQTGYAPFIEGVDRLLYGAESSAMADGRISTVQSVGGGNALFLGAMLYKESCDGVEPRLLL
ncbi:MAG: hypothetical protein RL417_141 [Pseudomonadota bacterium]